MKRGLFITFEGIDGAGKTTQIKLLQEYLISKKQPVRLSREPGGTRIGDKIRALILDKSNTDMCPMTELLLYYASRAQHIERVIAPALAQGECVICDRFYDSSYAYQQLGRGIDKKALDALTSMVAENYRPDITFLLDISPEVSAQRLHTRGNELDRLEEENQKFKEKVRQGFLAQAALEPDRVKLLDATSPAADIFAQIKEYINKLI
mgnify:CR=1 FL=1